MHAYPSPEPGASLILAFHPVPSTSTSAPQSILLLGTGRLTALRSFAALEAGYRVVVGVSPAQPWDPEVRYRIEESQVERIDWDLAADAGADEWRKWFSVADSAGQLDGVRLVVLTDTVAAGRRRDAASARAFRDEATRRRFFVNVADYPSLSDYSFASSHRFDLIDSSRKSPLQVALTTNSSACRLATRLRRELVAAMPKSAGSAVAAVGRLRDELRGGVSTDDDSEETLVLNRPVEQLTRAKSWALDEPGSSDWSTAAATATRMRYVSQISEYWPLDRLATVTATSLSAPSTPTRSPPLTSSYHDLAVPSDLALESSEPKKGRILLLGTGPGNPLLLTRIAHLLLTTSDPTSPFYIDLFLSDKLVPSHILDLIPAERRKGVVIARKYPGNAEAAQEELMALAIEAASKGKTVLRLKQGDPFLYGRGGEEVLRFRSVAGIESVVVPGLSSSLAGPAVAGIPVTQRGVAEQVVVCTGVGRGGRTGSLAQYERGKTLCVLMGVARLESLVQGLLEHGYPAHLPIALVERASAPDQRVVATTVSQIVDVLASLSAHRPPGMIVVGWAVMCLDGEGDMGILDAEPASDPERVSRWLGPKGYSVREGLSSEWEGLLAGVVG